VTRSATFARLTLAVAVAAGGWSAHAQEPSLATVLERAGDYVASILLLAAEGRSICRRAYDPISED
jgi:hypothetical protein